MKSLRSVKSLPGRHGLVDGEERGLKMPTFTYLCKAVAYLRETGRKKINFLGTVSSLPWPALHNKVRRARSTSFLESMTGILPYYINKEIFKLNERETQPRYAILII